MRKCSERSERRAVAWLLVEMKELAEKLGWEWDEERGVWLYEGRPLCVGPGLAREQGPLPAPLSPGLVPVSRRAADPSARSPLGLEPGCGERCAP